MERGKIGARILICDRIGLRSDPDGCHDFSEVVEFIEEHGGVFHIGPASMDADTPLDRLHFYYQPDLSEAEDLILAAGGGRYDAVIAAATIIPPACRFEKGGVRIGAGTGNMQSQSWGGSDGSGGTAPLMNTPGFNSRATAHMVFKAILRASPDLPLDELHEAVIAGQMDTGRDLKNFPTDKIEGKNLLVLGYGNIGREVAKLGKAFGMHVSIYARKIHRDWIEAQGYRYCETLADAATDAHFVSAHVGLGTKKNGSEHFANEQLMDRSFFGKLSPGAVVVNYDRGQIVDIDSLAEALENGTISFFAVDADIFVNEKDCSVSGPLSPYIALAKTYPGRMLLLPHAVADTDHSSRVEGAKQAVRQMFDSITHGLVTNLVGVLPEGYRWYGTKVAPGVGYVQAEDLKTILNDEAGLTRLRVLSWQMAEIWQGLTTNNIDSESRDLVLAINRYVTLVSDLGLLQPTRIEPFNY
ncbi:NAD(P)-dependent oxidoreductase [Agrobacterium larrymoorei]|uniref:Phosphoglycerate dehydrogenase n=1 Tax=Agrobacterium larrymoorei TaxID=160699 RepID=A0A4D7E4J8_9HYPH|nr:NAD(P)-dependent oxidoreductase [Agrobacterium larrymoorei]QCJ01093.1 phosphoglycerate dehydrogenase [Agrobacterium larrymoorei]QYA10107.1 phosphoglycerate dehydrogenase [Agrobacterium larrymoorei]